MHNLPLVCLLSLGVASNSTPDLSVLIPNEPPIQKSNTPYESDIELEWYNVQKTTSTQNITIPTENQDFELLSTKRKTAIQSNQKFRINATTYIQTCTWKNSTIDQESRAYLTTDGEGDIYGYTAYLTLFQIIPYSLLTNTEITYNSTINIQTYDSSDKELYDYLGYTTSDMSAYMDLTNYFQAQVLYNLKEQVINDVYDDENMIITDLTNYNPSTSGVDSVQHNATYNTQISFNRNEVVYFYHYMCIWEDETQAPQQCSVIQGTEWATPTTTNFYIEGSIIINDNYEVIDIPNLMFTILGMPFAFISRAFNLTLFPNTPYQVNIGNLFLVILGCLVLMFIIKLVISFIGKG